MPPPSASRRTVPHDDVADVRASRSVLSGAVREGRDLEQYFWTRGTVLRLLEALAIVEEGRVCCLATPALANAFWASQARAERCLDIDAGLTFLPKFTRWDMRAPTPPPESGYWVVVVDPPFFYIPMQQIFEAVVVACGGDFSTKLLFGFLARQERQLLHWFAPFGLRRTKFAMEYEHVKPNKWRNYALYSNVSLPGIRFASPQ